MSSAPTPARPRGRALRNVWAVFAGLLVVVVLSTVTDQVMHSTGIFPPIETPMANSLWWLATAYRVLFTIAGGFVTARLAPERPLRLAVILGAIGTLVGTAGVIATRNLGPAYGPRWYPILIAATGLPSCWVGGWLAGGRRDGRTS